MGIGGIGLMIGMVIMKRRGIVVVTMIEEGMGRGGTGMVIMRRKGID
ncbi:hypothetical protein A2U01_0108385, partial [Trifolium medium]|nr:hypothetical protein [Trifolium medium]